MELLLKALADPTRALILDGLVERDGQTLFEICARLAGKHGISPTRQAVSQHLAVLEAAGLLRSERVGRYKFHYVDTEPLREISRRWPPREPGPPGGRREPEAGTEPSSERTKA
ncbi:ArsR/SmtB family transcription factor [Paeniglutamicibacter sp. R2-26]|uniref:ArsR/SmtB family transcription factor n=1 Tax=Paeniglutamicibacter sp. R2-26 TaxID=3144417 RepID=UPI003EE5A076